jgi:hypothetical protein
MRWARYGNTHTSSDYEILELPRSGFRLDYRGVAVRTYADLSGAKRAALRRMHQERERWATR